MQHFERSELTHQFDLGIKTQGIEFSPASYMLRSEEFGGKMSAIIDGFKNQTWLIIKYDGLEKISEERIPQSEISELGIVTKLSKLSGETPQKDASRGNRVIYVAGQNPHWVASLWRSDELEERDRRNADRTGFAGGSNS